MLSESWFGWVLSGALNDNLPEIDSPRILYSNVFFDRRVCVCVCAVDFVARSSLCYASNSSVEMFYCYTFCIAAKNVHVSILRTVHSPANKLRWMFSFSSSSSSPQFILFLFLTSVFIVHIFILTFDRASNDFSNGMCFTTNRLLIKNYICEKFASYKKNWLDVWSLSNQPENQIKERKNPRLYKMKRVSLWCRSISVAETFQISNEEKKTAREAFV